ncbi:hypothetical protein M9Y10_010590 [Tritrichomonas musculus]|uniref:F5/8 type C domain-containing protein n=1 Tax=Tritrichomonas musculus TaxID=1915356 RepID=A0ABR2IL83_9EUKA
MLFTLFYISVFSSFKEQFNTRSYLSSSIKNDGIPPAEAVGNYVDNNYLAKYKIPNSAFNCESPGDQTNRPISNAFDGQDNTFWASSIVNNDTVKGHLIFEFTSLTCIEALIFGPAYSTNRNVQPNTRRYDGYPTTLKIYTSINNEDFKLKYTFTGSPKPTDLWHRIQFVFPDTVWCNKIKLEFTDVTLDVSFGNQHTAAAAEIYFVSPKLEHESLPPAEATGNYVNNDYLKEYKIQTNSFTCNSPGDQQGRSITNAFDGRDDTFWASSIVNTDAVKNTLTFEFNSITSIKALIYGPAFSTNKNVSPNTRRYDGYPLVLKVYTAVGEGDYELKYIFSGSPRPTDLWQRVQFEFPEFVWCDRIKLEFTEVTLDVSFGSQHTAAAAEIYFVSPPPELGNLSPAKATGNYANNAYINANKVPTDDFTYHSPGDQQSHPLSNAFDENGGTYWASSIVSNDNQKGYFTVDFKKTTNIQAILYDPAYSTNRSVTPNTRRYDGFPKILKVYTSLNKEPFKLMYRFSGVPQPTDLWDHVQFVFSEPIWCDKIKLEFTEVTLDIFFGNQYTAATAQIYFLTPQTEVPLPTEKPVDSVIIEETDCNDEGRYKKVVTEFRPVMVEIRVSNFTSVNANENGGAIHLENTGIQCENVAFDNCESNEVGGAVYIDNVFDYTNQISIENSNFNNCRAKYGGAVYLYSSSRKNTVKVKYCNFIGNTATSTSNDAQFGGSAIYVTARKGVISNNIYRGNQGDGGDLKIYNRFPNEENSNRLSLLDNKEEGSVVISDSTFEIGKKADCCLFYLCGDKGTNVELQRCVFSGPLGSNSHYINGKSISKDGPKIVVKRCKFSYDSTKAFNSDQYNEFMSIDLKDQDFEFNGSEIKKKSFSTWMIVAAVVASVVAVVAISGLIVFVKMRKNKNTVDENEMSSEVHNLLLSDPSLQRNDNLVNTSLI